MGVQPANGRPLVPEMSCGPGGGALQVLQVLALQLHDRKGGDQVPGIQCNAVPRTGSSVAVGGERSGRGAKVHGATCGDGPHPLI